jgi:CTD small phosphatase-like protein 2
MTFLKSVSAWFEIVLFTASQSVYANKLLDLLDPKKEYVKHRLFRDSCVNLEGNYLKDLSVLGRDLHRTCILDDSPQAFAFQVDHGIPIESWFDDDNDTELLKLIPFFKSLKDVDDVRPLIKQTFKLREYIDNL